jgi:hypothetical protein
LYGSNSNVGGQGPAARLLLSLAQLPDPSLQCKFEPQQQQQQQQRQQQQQQQQKSL